MPTLTGFRTSHLNGVAYYSHTKTSNTMAALNPDGTFSCVPFIAELKTFFAKNVPAGRIKTPAVLSALLSAKNNEGIEKIELVASNGGIRRTVRMTYDLPTCFTMLNTPFNCGATVQKIEVGPQYTDYDLPAHPYVPTVNGTNPMVRTWDWRQWTSLCITNQTEFFQRQVAKDLELIDEQVNKLVIGLLPANYGTFGSGHATPYNLPLFVPNTISSISSPNPNVYTDLEMELLESRITDRAMLLGGTNWKRYSNMMGYSGTSFFGLDASKQTTDMIDLVHDYDINSILSGGAGAAVIVPYKTMQVVQYREYEGEGRYVDMQQHKKFTVMTPAGLWVDMTWDLNLANRCNEVEVSYSVYLDVVSALPGGCNLPAGCNGIMPFVDCSAGASIPCPVTP